MEGTIWTIIPPILAIALALITKEVYFSLFIGICAGALMYTQFSAAKAFTVTIELMQEKVGANICIIIFLILLGMLVAAMSKSGASRAYGEWAKRNIKTKRGSLLATMALGVLIFIDDYFNCLTVGTIMSPITDKHKISRVKLAYIIDSTAAPICIIAPVSSWAAAVSSSLPADSTLDGFRLFIQAIPYNYYALLTILMLIIIIVMDFDFAKMKRYERTFGSQITQEITEDTPQSFGNGRVIDLILPIASLIIFCVLAMLYTGGFFAGGISIAKAFAECGSALSLVMGSFITVIITAALYLPRRILSFEAFMTSLVDGFKAMVPAVLILTFAWTLGGICSGDYLNIGKYVSGLIDGSAVTLGIIPVIFFLAALGLAFSTGTSWGTFAILLPIVFSIFGSRSETLLIISMAAVMGGAVNGDHISPISDTTILSSTGAGCKHIDHVNTQIPYALLVTVVCVVCYVIAGLSGNGILGLISGIILLSAVLLAIKRKSMQRE